MGGEWARGLMGPEDLHLLTSIFSPLTVHFNYCQHGDSEKKRTWIVCVRMHMRAHVCVAYQDIQGTDRSRTKGG